MRVGIFGGTFNPIHLGHLRSAEEVSEALALDTVYLVPAALPPHKDPRDVASPEHRLRMVELGTEDHPALRVSAIELSRDGPSYSVDTLDHFRCTLPRGSELHFVMGLDAFREIESWKDYARIFTLADLIVTSRPGAGDSLAPADLPVAIAGEFRYDPRARCLRHLSGHRLHFQRISGLEISASDIRRRVRTGRTIRYLVPKAVAVYITTHRLYQEDRPAR